MTTLSTRLPGTVTGILFAWVANLAIFFVADLGAPVRVVSGWAPDGADLTVLEVLITAATSIGIAGAALWWWERRVARALHWWSITVLALAALSAVPLWGLDIDLGSKTTLTLMHLATGGCAVLGQRLRPSGRAVVGRAERAGQETLS